MTRRRYVLDRSGTLKEVAIPQDAPVRLQIVADINPYESIVTGEEVGSRRAHREHLKVHSCEEIGSERPHLTPRHDPAPGGFFYMDKEKK